MRKIASVLMSIVAAGAIMVGVQSPANAAPTGCYYLTHPVFPSFGKAAYCGSGSGQFRIVIRCHDGFNSGYWYTYGAWVPARDYSMTACLSGPAGGFLVSYYLQKRG